MDEAERRKWLSSLRVGLEVAEVHPNCLDRPEAADVWVITGETKGTWECPRGDTFHKSTGKSTRWEHILSPVTPEIRDAWDRQRVAKAGQFLIREHQTLPITKVRKLLAILEETEQGEEES